MKIKIFTLATALLIINIYLPIVHADTITDNALNYLKTKQDATGQITGGSTGDASPWASIAFSANGIDTTTIKNPTLSLNNYLLSNHPATASAATEWEKWILAITASGQNPYNFGGVNYITTLESSTYYHNNQIGDSTSITDDWFGVMALISSGIDKADPVLTNSLSFILAHQNTDGGFGYSITSGSDGNDTAAAIQALVAAKSDGINTNEVKIDDVITKAKTYLLSTQDKSGGFLYDTSAFSTEPDSDSTTWALMALNVLGMKDSIQATSAKTWLFTQQGNDGGFQACQYNPPDYVCQLTSNSTTTSHALIGLAGKGWIVKIFNSSLITPTPTLSITPTVILTPTPIATINPTSTTSPTPTNIPSSVSTATGTPIPTLSPTLIPTSIPTQPIATTVPTQSTQDIVLNNNAIIPSPTNEETVLGAKTSNKMNILTKDARTDFNLSSFLAKIFLLMGIIFAGIYAIKSNRLRINNSRNK